MRYVSALCRLSPSRFYWLNLHLHLVVIIGGDGVDIWKSKFKKNMNKATTTNTPYKK